MFTENSGFLHGGLGQSSGWSQRSGDVGASSGGTSQKVNI